LIPARQFLDEGERIDPEVSVPRDARASPIEEETPGPELDPEGSIIL
jgi:hypothetical protein